MTKLISEHTGYESEEVHEIIKLRYLPVAVDIGGVGMIPGSTADLSTAEFEELMVDVRRWAQMELGIYIPEPNEVQFEY